MKTSIIAAMSIDRIIGFENKLPWHLPNDLKRFKEITTNNIVVMGKATYESIGFTPFKNRKNIVLSETMSSLDKNCHIVRSIDECFEYIKNMNTDCEIFFIGGQSVFDQAIKFVNKMYITFIYGEFNGDRFFPKANMLEWEQTYLEPGIIDKNNPFGHVFVTFERKNKKTLY